MKSLHLLFSVFFALSSVVHAADPGLIADGAKGEVLSEGYSFTEGPAVDRDGNVFFTDQPNDRIVTSTLLTVRLPMGSSLQAAATGPISTKREICSPARMRRTNSGPFRPTK